AVLDKLLALAPVGLHLAQPWRLVVAGPPNVGKSSLVNALVGFERAIVFDQPGTTRDVVTALTAFSGLPVELCDTAGLRNTDDSLEAAGVARAQEQAAAADLVLLVLDVSQPWMADQRELVDTWPRAIVVLNKADLVDANQPRSLKQPSVTTSVVTGE